MNAVLKIIVILFFIPQFTMGQDTLNKKSKKNIHSPHTFTSPISKQNYDSPDLEVQECKACHGPDRKELITRDSLLFNIKPSKSFFEIFGHYAYSYCSVVTKTNAPDGISSNCLDV